MADCNTYAGKNAFVLAGKETTFNTPATANKPLAVINTVNPSFNNNLIQVGDVGDRENVENIVGNFDTSISVDGTLNSGALLELFFGQATDTETTGDYKHVFVSRGTLDILDCVDSFTFSENFSSTTSVTKTYSGCKVNTLDISLEQGGVLEFSSEIIGSSVTTGTTPGTRVAVSTAKLSRGTLSTGADTSEAEVGRTRSFSISFGNNIDAGEGKSIGSRFNDDLIEKNLDTTVEFTKTFVDKTEFERFLGGTSPQNTPTDTSLIFAANNGVTLGSGRIEFYVKLSGGQYETVDSNTSQDGVVEETYSYVGGNIEDVWFVDQTSSYF